MSLKIMVRLRMMICMMLKMGVLHMGYVLCQARAMAA